VLARATNILLTSILSSSHTTQLQSNPRGRQPRNRFEIESVPGPPGLILSLELVLLHQTRTLNGSGSMQLWERNPSFRTRARR
jgi:hypothetical protein